MPGKRWVNQSITSAYINFHNNAKYWLNEELNTDLAFDPFAAYPKFTDDHHMPPKVLVATTSPKASKAMYDFCGELVGTFP